MTQFVEIITEDGNKIIYNANDIQKIQINQEKVWIYFNNNSQVISSQSYEEIKKQLLQ